MVYFVFILKYLLELRGTLIKNTNSNKTTKKEDILSTPSPPRPPRPPRPPAGIEPGSIACKVRVLTTIPAALGGRNDQLQWS